MSQDNTSRTNPSNESPSTRWWEAYAVRYFIGFVVGAICIAILLNDLELNNELRKFITAGKGEDDGSSPVFLIAILGLGYCYAASTPIAVLHFGRYGHGWVDGHARHFWFGWLFVILGFSFFGTSSLGVDPHDELAFFAIGLACSAVLPFSSSHQRHPLAFPSSSKLSKGLSLTLLIAQSCYWIFIVRGAAGALIGYVSPNLPDSVKMMWLFSAPVLWIGVSQYFVLFRLFTDQEEINQFYSKLFHARRQKNAKDVRDTYSHLREHSNSVFIVVVELSILACLLALHQGHPAKITSSLPLPSYYQWLFLGLAIWLLPTVFLWGRANAFEKSFANAPQIFLGRERNR